jgi:hypothetical protein
VTSLEDEAAATSDGVVAARADSPVILVVSLGTTGGWRAAATELADALGRVGVRPLLVDAGESRPVRTFALTDLSQALATRRAARAGIASHRPSAVIYCSMTSALLWPTPGAIWLDATATENRPGRHGVWQRPVERRRLQQAPVVMVMGERSLEPLRGHHADAVVVPSPVEPSVADDRSSERDIAAVTYAGDPQKKRLDVVLAAWERARQRDEVLVVAGTDELAPRPGVEVAGRLPTGEYRALLRRARAFVAAPRREDYGIAPLEALADGCLLVTTPAPGPYPALGLARELDGRLVSVDLAASIRVALDHPLPDYAARAAGLLAPFRRAAVDATIAERVLPRLLPDWS